MRETGGELSRGVLSAIHVLDSWHLTDEEIRGILGFPFGMQLSEWRKGNISSMPTDVITRIRFIGAIYHLLQTHALSAVVWLRRPMRQFAHQTALDRMASGDIDDLKKIHDFLKYGLHPKKAKI